MVCAKAHVAECWASWQAAAPITPSYFPQQESCAGHTHMQLNMSIERCVLLCCTALWLCWPSHSYYQG